MLANPTFDADLLARYDRPGPRYTSYPTAPQFADGFGEEQLRAAVLASNGDPIPRRLSRSEEHPSELQSLMRLSYAVFCLKKTKNTNTTAYSVYKNLTLII